MSDDANAIGPVGESAERQAWVQEFAVCRCEGPTPEPLQLNGRECCGRCHRPLVQ